MQRERNATSVICTLAMTIMVAGLPPALAHAGELDHQIQNLLADLEGSTTRFGLAVIDLETGETIFERHAHRPLIPASNQKIIAMTAALGILGPGFEFTTRLALRGQDIVIIGDGDPAIGDAKLCEKHGIQPTSTFARWIRALETNVHPDGFGDLVVDESIFDQQVTHPTWDSADLQKWYAAPVGALNLADNCIEVTLRPTRDGAPPVWTAEPASTVVRVTNNATSAAKGTVLISRPEVSFQYSLDGRCGSEQTLIPVPVPDPGLFFADAFRAALDRAGIRITGSIVRQRVRRADGSIPEDVRVIADHRTPIADVLQRIGTDSQNLFAECLAKRLGYEHMRRSTAATAHGSWVTAASAMRAFVRRIGIDTKGMIVADASGLSRENRATPAQLAAVLAHMHTRANGALFAQSLAAAGREGSLRKRMKDIPGAIAGKTGTLRGVRALSGYAMGKSGPRFAFSFIFNDIPGATARYKGTQDQLCRLLVSHAD